MTTGLSSCPDGAIFRRTPKIDGHAGRSKRGLLPHRCREGAWLGAITPLACRTLLRMLDILLASPRAAESVGTLVVWRARLLVRTGVLLIVGVLNSRFGLWLLHALLLLGLRSVTSVILAAGGTRAVTAVRAWAPADGEWDRAESGSVAAPDSDPAADQGACRAVAVRASASPLSSAGTAVRTSGCPQHMTKSSRDT